MKGKVFFKILKFILFIITTYFLYKQIILLKNEYIERSKNKELLLNEVDSSYKERTNQFYKNK
ncbi:MAG: hypothetical protein ACRCYT_07800 [Cetobacterium sp.]